MTVSFSRWQELLSAIYEETSTPSITKALEATVAKWKKKWGDKLSDRPRLSERDVLLITYADQVQDDHQPALQTLTDFCNHHLEGLVSCIHILPFYPASSDDGFSVIDYRRVEPTLGTWGDITRLGERFHLMFDGVINHVSVQSHWFQAFLRDEEPWRNYFIVVEGEPDLSGVARPRILPLLTRFGQPPNEKHLWTTFSADQVDLNYHNPQVLLEMIDLLLFYAGQGADLIRLDAIAYLWKEIGTACIHLPRTHQIIQLLRAVLEKAAPHVKLVTETNVPEEKNLSYFGDGTNEAHLVYNFALPPLVLHTLQTGNARALTRWAADLRLPSDEVTFLNFLASHDGIGLEPARGILSAKEIDDLVEKTLKSGQQVSYRQGPGGTQIPYELNVNYFDALCDPTGGEETDLQVDRFMAAQAIMLSLAGLPGIYFHSLFGSRGWLDGVALTGRNRTVNRQKLLCKDLEAALKDENSLRHKVFTRYQKLLRARATSPAFDPYGSQKVLDLGEGIWAVLRENPRAEEQVLCLQNVTSTKQSILLDTEAIFHMGREAMDIIDLISGEKGVPDVLPLTPWQTCWLAARPASKGQDTNR